jgi:DNA repair protein RAD16
MTSKPANKRQVAVSSASSAVSDASTRGNSVSYDTPNTTAANTPAGEFGSFGAGSGPKFSLGGRSLIASQKRKRGRPSKTAATQNDEEIARQLQEEEYGVAPAGSSKLKSRRESTPMMIADSDDVEDEEDEEEEEDEDVKEESSEDEPLFKKRGRPSKAKNTPQRSAGKMARSRIASSKVKAEDQDEDEAEESEFDPDDEDDQPLAKRHYASTASLSSTLSPSISVSPAPSIAALADAAARRRANRMAANRARLARLRGSRMSGAYDRKAARRAKLEKAHPEIKTMWKDLEKVPIIKPVEAAQPESITRRLKPFQLEGLDWMMKQEKSSYKGGLLGDEMGMGKTIQTVSLIMSDFPAKEPSLVLVPPVALMQWQNEINAYTDGKLKVLVVHNTNAKSKGLTHKVVRAHNVVIMSYNSLESMFRKQEKGWSRGENIIKEDSPIHAIKFHRVILDEAHSIKSRTTGVAKACFALKGNHKWCLSGTPVQNRIGEFFSLLRFLEVRPFADYFCEKCPCSQLHWSVGEDYMCTHCKHSAAEHRSVFNEELLNPITGDSMELRSEALDKLHMITARVMLRRMKKDHTASMELPPKEIVIHNEFFGEMERDFSSSIMSNTTRKFDTYVAQGVMLNNYANIFGLIMQMRQVANHPDLITRRSAEGGQNVLVCSICDEPAEEAIKSGCQGSKCHFCRTCVKTYMQTCEASGSEADCPRCHIPLTIDWDQPEIIQDEDEVKKSSIINRINMENWTSSTKIEMLVYDLYKLRSKKQTLKSIVFSQFTSMLQLIDWRLRRAGFNTVMLDGSMTPAQRQRSIDYFMNNADVEVFLVSLKAGGVALNLTEASRVFIVDP